MAINVRRLLSGEERLANDFFNSVYRSNRSLENFQWEFVNGPEGPAIYIVAVDDQVQDKTKIVGIQCAIPLKLQDASGNAVLTAKSEDTLVDPAYRGQKIFERMYEVLFDECSHAGIRYIWGFTPARKAFERIGFEIPFMAHQALMVFNARHAYKHLSSLNPRNEAADKFKIAGLALVSKLMSFVNYRRTSTSLTVQKIDTMSLQPIISRLSNGTPWYFLSMDERYVRWRINENPFNNQYESFAFRQGERLVAAATINCRPGRFGYIEQLIFAGDASGGVKRDVLLHLVRLMRPRVDFIRALCFDTNEVLREQEGLFRQTGFMVIRRGAFFVWKSLGAEALEPRQLFLTRLFTQGNQ